MTRPVQSPPDTTPLTAALDREYEVMREKAAAWDTHVAQGRAANDAMVELVNHLKAAVADLPTEPIDYRRCPRPKCGSVSTYMDGGHLSSERRTGYMAEGRGCLTCGKPYRVEFRVVRVGAE